MNQEERDLARHALGLTRRDARKRSYRNYYVALASSKAGQAWLRMTEAGEAVHYPPPTEGEDILLGSSRFHLTQKGAEAALDKWESLCPQDFPKSRRRAYRGKRR